MKISIITVCLNAKDTIESTFLSVFSQTYKNVELIVIDGASNDGTLDIIEKYKERISHFVSEPDKGIYDAMNKGIMLATGDFLIFLNANDVFYDEYVLEKVANTLNENPEAKFLFGNAEYISTDKQESQILSYDNIKNDFSIIFDNICHQSVFYRKSLFEEFGLYSEQFKIYSDWDFNIKCLAENKVKIIYLPLIICKFQLGGACSNSNSEKTCKFEKKALIENYYSKYKCFLLINDFLRSHLGFIYKIFIKKIIDLIISKNPAINLNICNYSRSNYS
jgi:glycosyltransferase involved in cell wall biosynthesis